MGRYPYGPFLEISQHDVLGSPRAKLYPSPSIEPRAVGPTSAPDKSRDSVEEKSPQTGENRRGQRSHECGQGDRYQGRRVFRHACHDLVQELHESFLPEQTRLVFVANQITCSGPQFAPNGPPSSFPATQRPSRLSGPVPRRSRHDTWIAVHGLRDTDRLLSLQCLITTNHLAWSLP